MRSGRKETDKPEPCGNCNEPGHELAKCPGPPDQDGFINGCPVCNTKEHIFDLCPQDPLN